jgi:DNA-binding NtrC family response regulator
LVKAFSAEVSERLGRPFSGISDEAMEILKAHTWPGNVRELRNLVESMVVMAPGQRIQPRDIPAEIRGGSPAGGQLLPVPVVRATGEIEDTGLRPQLEFVFRTLVDMRVDLDDLRREFEAWQSGPEGSAGGALGFLSDRAARPTGRVIDVWEDGRPPAVPPSGRVDVASPGQVDVSATADEGSMAAARPLETTEVESEEGVVVFRPGMTMEDLEREAIRAALESVGGNRRRASELLEIGERTLYRKIKKFGLDEL